MVELLIDNSISKISNLDIKQFNALRAKLSYQVDANSAFFGGGHKPRVKYCIDAKGYFPSGLFPRVEDFLQKNDILFIAKDARMAGVLKIPRVDHKPNFKGITPYDDQFEAEEALAVAGRGIISMPTGSGKSLVAALITRKMSVRTLIIVPSLQIKEQLTKDFQALFKDMSNITIENIDSKALQTASDYDLLIIDEAHHVAAKTYQKLNKGAWKGIYYRAFLTATPFRNQTEETLLFEGIAGSVIFHLSYADAVKKGYIVPIEAYYIEIPKQETDAYTWAQVYSELVVNNEPRNRIITHLLVKLASTGSILHTLCLVKEVKHGDNLHTMMPFPFANGQDEHSRRYIDMFNSGKLQTLIGTEGILGEGVDTKPCEFVIIAGLGKAKSAFMQKVGRAVRRYGSKESAKIILILDRSHKFTLKHYREQCKILKQEYGIVPVKLEI